MAALLWLAANAFAATWVVDPAGGGDSTTIRDGVDLMSDGDTLQIRAGVYTEGEIIVTATGASIEGDGPDVTVLDGMGIDEQGLSMLAGNTIRGLSFENFTGAGLYVVVYGIASVGTTTVVEDCAFANTDDVVGQPYTYHQGLATEGGDAELIVLDSLFHQADLAYWHDYWTTIRVENSVFVDASVTLADPWTYPQLIGCADYDFHHNLIIRGSISTANPFAPRTCDKQLRFNMTNNILLGATAGYGIDEGYEGIVSGNLFATDVAEPEGTLHDGKGSHSVTITDNLIADPEFFDWSDDDDWLNDDFRLLAASPGVDLGVIGYAEVTADVRGYDRSIDGDGDGVALPDAGPYELDPSLDSVDTGVGDTGVGDTGGSDTGTDSDSGAAIDSGDTAKPTDSASTDSDPATETGDGWSATGDTDAGTKDACSACGGGGAAWLLLLLPLAGWRRRPIR